MSRIGNNPIAITEGTTVSLDNDVVTVKGKLGELSQEVDSSITISINENEMILSGERLEMKISK